MYVHSTCAWAPELAKSALQPTQRVGRAEPKVRPQADDLGREKPNTCGLKGRENFGTARTKTSTQQKVDHGV